MALPAPGATPPDDPGGGSTGGEARGYWGNSVLADAGAKPGWRREYEQRRAA